MRSPQSGFWIQLRRVRWGEEPSLVPGCRAAFPPQGEGGPLAVDEVPAKRIKDSVVPGQVGQKVRPLVFNVPLSSK